MCHRGARTILERCKPEALFCTNDYMAAGAMRYSYEKGLRIPEDIALIGYDNLDIAQSVYPQLTTVDNRVYDVGKQLTEALLQLIREETDVISRELKPFLQEGRTV